MAGIFDRLTDFFNKYGGRNGTEVASDYDDNSYGNVTAMGSLGANYGSYKYTNRDVSAKKHNGYGPGDKRAYDVTGNTKKQFATGGEIVTLNRERGRFGNMSDTYYKHWDKKLKTYYEKRGFKDREKQSSYPADFSKADRQPYTGGSRRSKENDKLWVTPTYGNQVYYANYDADDSFNDNTKWTKDKTPLKKHNTKLENGNARSYTYSQYPANTDGNYKKALEHNRKQREAVEKQNKGYQFNGFDIEDILNTNGITMNRLKNRVIDIKRININRSLGFTDVLNFGKQYIFFSKPDLNLFSDNAGTINPSIKQNCPDLYMKILRNPLVAQQLQSSFGGPNRGSGGGIITQLTNRCNDCPWPDFGLSKK